MVGTTAYIPRRFVAKHFLAFNRTLPQEQVLFFSLDRFYLGHVHIVSYSPNMQCSSTV